MEFFHWILGGLLDSIRRRKAVRREYQTRLEIISRVRGRRKAIEILNGDPEPGTEDWYNKHAKLSCQVDVQDHYGVPGCGGEGMIFYRTSENESHDSPCVRCFPHDPWARRGYEEGVGKAPLVPQS